MPYIMRTVTKAQARSAMGAVVQDSRGIWFLIRAAKDGPNGTGDLWFWRFGTDEIHTAADVAWPVLVVDEEAAEGMPWM